MPGGIEDKPSGSWEEARFPQLSPGNCRVTSPPANRYNCIAWAVGTEDEWWWPERFSYWPPGVPRQATLAAFLAAFATRGFEQCSNGLHEPGFEKIALYGHQEPLAGVTVPSHAARQLLNGHWTSKMGALEDIEHLMPEDVCGPAYGSVIAFMKRSL